MKPDINGGRWPESEIEQMHAETELRLARIHHAQKVRVVVLMAVAAFALFGPILLAWALSGKEAT